MDFIIFLVSNYHVSTKNLFLQEGRKLEISNYKVSFLPAQIHSILVSWILRFKIYRIYKILESLCSFMTWPLQMRIYDPRAQRRPVKTIPFMDKSITAVSNCFRDDHILAANATGEMGMFDIRAKGYFLQFIRLQPILNQ